MNTQGDKFFIYGNIAQAVILLLIFIGSFSLSFEAQNLEAAKAWSGNWLGLFGNAIWFAIIVDGSILAASVAMVQAGLSGDEDTRKFSFIVLVVATLLSILFNYWHNNSPMSVVPPVFLAGTIHLLSLQAKSVFRRVLVVEGLDTLEGELNSKEAALQDVQEEIRERQAELEELSNSKDLLKLIIYLKGAGFSNSDVAKRLKITDGAFKHQWYSLNGLREQMKELRDG